MNRATPAPLALRACELLVERRSARALFELRVQALELHLGQVLAILGPNGAGKTTLLRALAGLERPRSGRVETHAQGPVTMVFQRPIALSGSVLHNVRVGLSGLQLPRAERDRRAREALARFGIAELAERRSTQVSSGELRRLALARAFALGPAVLLLDEPFDDLDPGAQETLSLDLRQAIDETGVAVALVTHDLRRATRLADRMAVLLRGELAQTGSPDQVLRRPADLEVAALVGMLNLIPGRLCDGFVQVGAQHRIAVAAAAESACSDASPSDGARVICGVRPEHVKLDIGRGESAPIGTGIVRALASDGLLTTVRIAWAGHELVTHLVSGRGLARTLRLGDEVLLSIRPNEVHVLPAP